MVAPMITVESVTRNRLGRVTGWDASTVTFTTNQDLMEWEARADGHGAGQGLLLGEQRTAIEDNYALKLQNPWNETMNGFGPLWSDLGANTFNAVSYGSATFVIDDSELTSGDKPYVINVYGKNEAGEWNGFQQGNLVKNPSFEQGVNLTWGTWSTSGTITEVTGQSGSGKAARITINQNGSYGLISERSMNLNEGETIEVSFFARANRNYVELNYIYFMSSSSGNKSQNNIPISKSWEWYRFEWVVPAGESASDYGLMLSLYAGRNGVLPGDWVELDEVSVKKGVV